MTTPVSEGYVVDSSVVVRWYVEQVGFEHARDVQSALLAGALRLEAPDICRWEVGNVLRNKGVLTGRLTAEQALGAVADLEGFGVALHSTDLAGLLSVMRLSLRLGLSLFDAAFVDLALRTGLPLLTADARLARSVAGLVSTEVLRGVVPGLAST